MRNPAQLVGQQGSRYFVKYIKAEFRFLLDLGLSVQIAHILPLNAAGRRAGVSADPFSRTLNAITMSLMVRRCPLSAFRVVALFCLAVIALGQPEPEEVTFESNGLQLHGFLWRPSGNGPFPTILWNHGSEKRPGSQPILAKFYTQNSYVFFSPHRRGQGRSPGNYIQDLVAEAAPWQRAKRMMELQDEQVSDVIAALDFLKTQSFVDPRRIAISGCSYGGIQTLLTGEYNLGVLALIPFAPGAMSWDRNPEVSVRLRRAVDQAKAPVFLLQAENDYSIEPSRALSKEASKHGKDFRSRIYPAFGNTRQDGHWGFCSTATDVWGNDVLTFLEQKTTK